MPLADQVEALLEKRGLRLTMGGEPTYIPDQPEGIEWSTSAIGPEKLGYARRMTAKLIQRTFPGGLVMQVFGKQYPGEPLPRWNLLTLQRKAGVPLWTEPKRFLLDDAKGTNTPGNAKKLILALGKALGIEATPLPCTEDGTKKIVGWALPLDHVDGTWQTDAWPYGPDQPITLIPGDSPVGLRLPLSQLPAKALRRALTVEVRRGALEVFLPPLDWIGFQAFIGELQALCAALNLRDLVVCGYAPYDTHGETTGLGLAADPGVLEANLPPCATWREYDAVLQAISKAAHAVGLVQTKRALNGVIRGTGGGAHLAFGGPSPEENPFFNQPGLLPSVLRYWQRHPALSYLFTGQYVGAGCQAPRVDEGARHALYELEVACEGLDALHQQPSREMLDQFFRNLLTDPGGNTHRAEICFDKFWNFAAPNGKLGILELRAFETLPEAATMSEVALLVRAVIAMLAKRPCRQKLRRWGPALHDKFFLPAVLMDNLATIARDLRHAGLDFNPESLRPVMDFRCPVLGTLDIPGGTLEVRQALEAWPLMAEESRGEATVRVVDNSTDRLQFTLSDPALAERGQLVVGGVALPWRQADGRAVIGARYKCASAYPALHPHVAIQSPLLIQWVCKGKVTAARYHYWNPHGPAYDGPPRTDREAQKRREERWEPLPASAPPRHALAAPTAPEYRWTIDLRQALR